MANQNWRRIVASIDGANLSVIDRAVSATPTLTALPGAGLLTVPLFSLDPGEFILGTKLKHSTAFSGGAVTAATAELGITGALDRYASRFNVFQAVADTSVARLLQRGPTLKMSMSNGIAAAGPAAALGLLAGDRVLGLQGFSLAAGYTGAASEGAAFNSLVPGVAFEPVITVNAQIQQLDAVDRSDGSVLVLAESGGGLESDTVATPVQLTLRTTGANVNALIAGSLVIWVQTDRAPLGTLGIG
jgi:hypothetical protein